MIIDRIEGDIAIVEFAVGEFEDIPVERIEGDVRDGALLVATGGDRYAVDEQATEARMREMERKARSLFE